MLCSMALPSKFYVALHDQSNVDQFNVNSHAEVWTCQFWWNFYSFIPIKLHWCFGHCLKICRWFGYNPQITYSTQQVKEIVFEGL